MGKHVQALRSLFLSHAPFLPCSSSWISRGDPKHISPLDGEEEEGKGPLSFLTSWPQFHSIFSYGVIAGVDGNSAHHLSLPSLVLSSGNSAHTLIPEQA